MTLLPSRMTGFPVTTIRCSSLWNTACSPVTMRSFSVMRTFPFATIRSISPALAASPAAAPAPSAFFLKYSSRVSLLDHALALGGHDVSRKLNQVLLPVGIETVGDDIDGLALPALHQLGTVVLPPEGPLCRQEDHRNQDQDRDEFLHTLGSFRPLRVIGSGPECRRSSSRALISAGGPSLCPSSRIAGWKA